MIDKEKLTNAVIKRAVKYYFNGINVVEAIDDFENTTVK